MLYCLNCETQAIIQRQLKILYKSLPETHNVCLDLFVFLVDLNYNFNIIQKKK